MLKKIIKSYDYSLIIAVILLAVFGLIMVYSASMVTAVQKYEVATNFFYQKQKSNLLFAFVVFVLVSLFPYKALKNNTLIGIGWLGALSVLVLLLIFGHAAGNAQSWFKLGARSLQPAEFVKLFVIVYLASVYSNKQKYINDFNRGILPPLLLLALACVLIALQPDFGTAAIIFAISLTMILSSGMNLKNIAKLVILGLVCFVLIFLILNKYIFSEERLGRFSGFSDPFADVQDHGYHLINSYLAIAGGGLKGLGLGQSIQKQGYLPESHTDFIMAIIAEELGILGVAFVLVILGFIVLRGYYISLRCRDAFGSLLAIGISSMIGIQAGINLAGISGLMPITGVTLPFISYGGSSLIQLAIAMGILVNVSMFVNFERKYKNKEQKNESVIHRKGLERSLPLQR